MQRTYAGITATMSEKKHVAVKDNVLIFLPLQDRAQTSVNYAEDQQANVFCI